MNKNNSNGRNLDPKTIFKNEEFIGDVFRDLQDYLRKTLKKTNGIYECHSKSENDEEGRWEKTNTFCRNRGIDETFICLLNDVLGGLTCEAEIVNEITLEGLIDDLRSFRSQGNPDKLEWSAPAVTHGKEY